MEAAEQKAVNGYILDWLTDPYSGKNLCQKLVRETSVSFP